MKYSLDFKTTFSEQQHHKFLCQFNKDVDRYVNAAVHVQCIVAVNRLFCNLGKNRLTVYHF